MWRHVAARGVRGNLHDLGVLFEVAEHLLASCPLFDLYLAVLERGSQGFGIALLNCPGPRVLFSGMLNPSQRRGAGGQPFPAHLAAWQFSFLT
jgi:hypothetical protein